MRVSICGVLLHRLLGVFLASWVLSESSVFWPWVMGLRGFRVKGICFERPRIESTVASKGNASAHTFQNPFIKENSLTHIRDPTITYGVFITFWISNAWVDSISQWGFGSIGFGYDFNLMCENSIVSQPTVKPQTRNAGFKKPHVETLKHPKPSNRSQHPTTNSHLRNF